MTLGHEQQMPTASPTPGAGGSSAFADLLANFNVLTDAMPQMVWSTLPDGFHDYFNARWYEFTGMHPGTTDGDGWSDMFHPDDRDKAWTKWRHSLRTGEPYEVEYRLRHRSGAYRWTLGRALPVRDASGRITRWIGTCTDIDAAKRGAERDEILSRELSHRIKNIFAVVNGLIGLSAREHPEAKDYAKKLKERIAALGRAHELVRPHADQSDPQFNQIGLHELLRELLSPYPALAEGRIQIIGDNLAVDDRSTTPLALAFHELATNSTKYGAIGATGGNLTLNVLVATPWVIIEWVEQAGSAATPISRGVPGFGSRLISLSIENQLCGKIGNEWRDDGLTVRMRIPLESIVRRQSV
jgi:PAS domain S-box-containing protein